MTRPPVVDPRGQRLAASITAVVLAVVLLTGSAWLLAAQAAVFAIGAAVGPGSTPYATFFRRVVRPRLGPPQHTEAAAPPRFAQAVGLGFAVVGLVALLAGATTVFLVAIAAALAAAFLNAAFGLCLGCEVYLFAIRFLHRTGRTGRPEPVTLEVLP